MNQKLNTKHLTLTNRNTIRAASKMGVAKVGLNYKAEHVCFLLAFILNLNFGTFNTQPSQICKPLNQSKTAAKYVETATDYSYYRIDAFFL